MVEARASAPAIVHPFPSSSRVAVIDLGSNSGRIVILERSTSGTVHVLDEERVSLNLIGELDDSGAISDEGRARIEAALRDFRSIARGWDVESPLIVGTQALRSSTNGAEIVAAAKDQFGLTIELIDGEREAELAFLGAVQAVPVRSGISVDIGGGSLELTRFEDRGIAELRSLPLGALAMKAHLRGDPPEPSSLADLRSLVTDVITPSELRLAAGDWLIGSGGTIRNLAKVDRRRRGYPVERVHGYVLTRTRLNGIIDDLAELTEDERAATPGLSSARAASIVAGGIVLDEVMASVRTARILVSGRGMREGVAIDAGAGGLASVEETRRFSVEATGRRFASWRPAVARARTELAMQLAELIAPELEGTLRVALETAATLIDCGGAVNAYNRHRHAAEIVMESELDGLWHEESVGAAALIRLAERPGASLRDFRPILDRFAEGSVGRAATILGLSDEVVRRVARESLAGIVPSREGARLTIDGAGLWLPPAMAERVARDFDLELRVD